MIQGSNRKMRLSNSATYLQDIFSNTPYIELGNIDYEIMEKILNFERIRIEEISDFNIQNSGMSNFKINRESLQNIIPYMFIDSLNKKNRVYQLFLTYGLVRYRDNNKEEKFAPIVLIPVNLYFENNQIYLQKYARPIANDILINILSTILTSDQRRLLPTQVLDRFDSLYSIDRYILQLANIEGLDVKLENYLTIAKTVEDRPDLKHSKFPIVRDQNEALLDKLYSKECNLRYIAPLNKKQREALYNASIGNSFVIVGRLGTGKTLTLTNICLEAITQGKRILYISNQDETLETVFNKFNSLNLENYVVNFANSFAYFNYGEVSPYPKGKFEELTEKAEVLELYKEVNDYESKIYSKIQDYRYVEVLTELAVLSLRKKKILEIDNLDILYKYEFLDVIKALEEIESYRKIIPSISKNKWHQVLISSDFLSRNNILDVLKQIKEDFLIIEKEKQTLETKYGVVPQDSLSRFRNTVSNIKKLALADLPESWKKVGFASYEEAIEEFEGLKAIINSLKEIEYSLDAKWKDYKQIDIDALIKEALGKHSKKDIEYINALLKARTDVTSLNNNFAYQKELYEINSRILEEAFGIELYLNDEMQENLIEFLDLYKNGDFKFKDLVVYSQDKIFVRQLFRAEAIALRYSRMIDEFQKEYPYIKMNNLESYVSILAKDKKGKMDKQILNAYRKEGQRKVKEDSETLIKKTKQAIDSQRGLMKLDRIYENHFLGSDFLGTVRRYKNIETFFEKNRNVNFKKALVKLAIALETYKEQEKTELTNALNAYSGSIGEINKLTRSYAVFGFESKKNSFKDIYQELTNFYDYISSLYKTNDILLEQLVNRKKYVALEEYYILSESKKKISEYIKGLENNKKYQKVYGVMYQNEETNLNTIQRTLQNFKKYCESFIDDSKVIASLNPKNYQEIDEHLSTASEASEGLNRSFQNYAKYFQTGVSYFLYFDFSVIIEHLNTLLKKEKELDAYLVINKNIRKINNYRLESLSDIIVSENKGNQLVDSFKYTYFTYLKNEFSKKEPNNEDCQEALNKIMVLEKTLIEKDINNLVVDIRKHSSSRFSTHNIKELDYRKYIKRTKGTKYLFLAPVSLLNYYLDVNDFDLVIIDDAQLLNASEYYNAVLGKQIIISGELQPQGAVFNTLISRMMNETIIKFDFRYLPTPKKLLNYLLGLQSLIKNTYSGNRGIEILKDKIVYYITLLYMTNKDIKINIFIRNFEKQKEIYREIANSLINAHLSTNDIYTILTRRINIGDINNVYLYHADYNIIWLEDYYEVNLEHISLNILDTLLLCNERVIIYDSNNYIRSDNLFPKTLNGIVNEDDAAIFEGVTYNQMNLELKKLIEAKGYKVYEAPGDINLIIEKNDRLYGILLFFDYMKIHYEILNEYRDYYEHYRASGFKMINVWITHFDNDLKKIADYIVKEIKNETKDK
ncbi:MAG TPA: hypothetical protein PKZ13_00025 [Bacilli bacterium]|nr:hypothetical protein [Bacilli bacterium]